MTDETKQRREMIALLNALPPEWPNDLLADIQAAVRVRGTKIFVLDDDPTGTQTVHGVPVLTEWTRPVLEGVLRESHLVTYVLTNSRSLSGPEAQSLGRQIGANLRAAGAATGREFVVISRSDSTLRGHFPGEVDALVEELGTEFDGTLIIPFFLEGGRYTIHDVHYVADDEWLVPAAETEYARDVNFGYHNSNLRDWVSEKRADSVRPEDVISISLEDIRVGGPAAVTAALQRVTHGRTCVVNATTYRDLEVFVYGLLNAEAAGQRFIYRSAASFVRVRGGIAPRPLLNSAEMIGHATSTGGLIVVGSYVERTTLQLKAAKSLDNINWIEVPVDSLLDAAVREAEIERVVERANDSLEAGLDTLIFTSRELLTGPDQASALQIGQVVSSSLVSIVNRLDVEPAWIIAKGGITSSDVATKGLGVRRAEVLGQVLPGIPVWRTGQESRWPDKTYIVFPGNVGGPGALADVIMRLRG